MARPGHDDRGGSPHPGGQTQPVRHAKPRRPKDGASKRLAPDGTVRLQRTPGSVLIWGFHAAIEALRSPRRTPLRIVATAAAAARVAAEAQARDLVPLVLEAGALDAFVPREAVHQGLVVEARPLDSTDISDLPDSGTVLVLDQVTDPHNVGAILRTAAAYGVAALVTTERHAPDVTGVLAKAASGGLEHVPIVAVGNLARALDHMTRGGYQLIGLDSDGEVPLERVKPAAAIALVLGAEGKGLRRLTRERCTVVARLALPGAITSLNVSNACAVALTILRLASARG